MHIVKWLQNISELKLIKLKGETDESTLRTFFSIIGEECSRQKERYAQKSWGQAEFECRKNPKLSNVFRAECTE